MDNKRNLIVSEIIDKIDAPNQGISRNVNNKSIRAENDIDAIKIWLAEFQNTPNTFISYRQTALRFILWITQFNLTLAKITREDIQDYQAFLANPTPKDFWCGSAKPRNHPDWRPFVKGLTQSSIKLNLQILTTMYEYLVQSGYLVVNPFKLIKNKGKGIVSHQHIERYLTHKEWSYVLEYIENLPRKNKDEIANYQRIKWIFTLLYLSGCRRNEIANARMSDFMHKHEHWWLKVIGKGNKYGEIPVTNDLLQALIQYRRSIGLSDYPTSVETNIALVNNVHLSNNKFKGISSSMLYKIIKITCKKIADVVKVKDPSAAFVIEKVSTHWLRHTSATHQVDAGIDIRVVKENLRHSMLETTMKYQHTEADSRHEETNNKFGIK
ncbi:MAG TPA: tyrosine-type recombinase/integrase [Burkholderiales bacterium]|nr:tyrosine-type recombinase/integrase [Burkholderiales bacterium]